MEFPLRIFGPLAMLLRRFDSYARPLQMATDTEPPFMLRHSNPAGLWHSPRLTQMVEVQGARMIYLSGQTPADQNYRVRGGDVRAQTHAVYDNIEIALKSVNAGWDNVVKTTTYLTDAALIKDFREARMERFGKLKATPANTLLVVSRLAEPEFLVEIDVVAAVPPR
ncbi:MAG TPA: RidA family protein [Burkholderiales bacterium]|nr:RidA family protein [Burkholderiales bacterium]